MAIYIKLSYYFRYNNKNHFKEFMMHSIQLNIEDSVFEKVIYFLQNLPKNEVQIVEDRIIQNSNFLDSQSELKAFSNHTASLIEEWQDSSEDEIWK